MSVWAYTFEPIAPATIRCHRTLRGEAMGHVDFTIDNPPNATYLTERERDELEACKELLNA